METKRELEFEIIMLEEQNQKIDNREQKRLDQMQHKIDVSIMNQEKIKQKSKYTSFVLQLLSATSLGNL